VHSKEDIKQHRADQSLGIDSLFASPGRRERRLDIAVTEAEKTRYHQQKVGSNVIKFGELTRRGQYFNGCSTETWPRRLAVLFIFDPLKTSNKKGGRGPKSNSKKTLRDREAENSDPSSHDASTNSGSSNQVGSKE
jgi:hypothetical protein